MQRTYRLAVHARGANAFGNSHEEAEQAALEAAGVFHADHHAGQQAFKNARRCKVIGRPDLFQVNGHRADVFRAVHHVAAAQPLGVAENVLPDPGRRQVSQHFFLAAELVEFGAGLCAIYQRAVRVHHTFGVAGGARGEEHGSHFVGLAQGELRRKEIGLALRKAAPGLNQCVQ